MKIETSISFLIFRHDTYVQIAHLITQRRGFKTHASNRILTIISI